MFKTLFQNLFFSFLLRNKNPWKSYTLQQSQKSLVGGNEQPWYPSEEAVVEGGQNPLLVSENNPWHARQHANDERRHRKGHHIPKVSVRQYQKQIYQRRPLIINHIPVHLPFDHSDFEQYQNQQYQNQYEQQIQNQYQRGHNHHHHHTHPTHPSYSSTTTTESYQQTNSTSTNTPVTQESTETKLRSALSDESQILEAPPATNGHAGHATRSGLNSSRGHQKGKHGPHAPKISDLRPIINILSAVCQNKHNSFLLHDHE